MSIIVSEKIDFSGIPTLAENPRVNLHLGLKALHLLFSREGDRYVPLGTGWNHYGICVSDSSQRKIKPGWTRPTLPKIPILNATATQEQREQRTQATNLRHAFSNACTQLSRFLINSFMPELDRVELEALHGNRLGELQPWDIIAFLEERYGGLKFKEFVDLNEEAVKPINSVAELRKHLSRQMQVFCRPTRSTSLA
jgi:hypothetical protein